AWVVRNDQPSWCSACAPRNARKVPTRIMMTSTTDPPPRAIARKIRSEGLSLLLSFRFSGSCPRSWPRLWRPPGLVAPSAGRPTAARPEDESSLTMKSSPSGYLVTPLPRYLGTWLPTPIQPSASRQPQGPDRKNERSVGEHLIPAGVHRAA